MYSFIYYVFCNCKWDIYFYNGIEIRILNNYCKFCIMVVYVEFIIFIIDIIYVSWLVEIEEVYIVFVKK